MGEVKRDLAADLAICNAATPGLLKTCCSLITNTSQIMVSFKQVLNE